MVLTDPINLFASIVPVLKGLLCFSPSSSQLIDSIRAHFYDV